MANSTVFLGALPLSLQRELCPSIVRQYRITLDTVGTLSLYTPPVGNYCGIVYWVGATSAAATLRFLSGATNIGELPLAADTTISKGFGGGDGIIYNTIAIDDTLSIELLSGAMSNPIVVGIVDIPMTGACLSN